MKQISTGLDFLFYSNLCAFAPPKNGRSRALRPFCYISVEFCKVLQSQYGLTTVTVRFLSVQAKSF